MFLNGNTSLQGFAIFMMHLYYVINKEINRGQKRTKVALNSYYYNYWITVENEGGNAHYDPTELKETSQALHPVISSVSTI